MADKVTFDFDTGEIIFDTHGQKGIEIDPDLRKNVKRSWQRQDIGGQVCQTFVKKLMPCSVILDSE